MREIAESRWCLAATILLAALFLHALAILWIGLFQPLLDLHSFRQTQTALTAYWLFRGGPWFAYETPVVGYPWSIPFEFPLYQGLVALLRLAGIPIDIGGRLVSFCFYLGCLWPLWWLSRTLRLGRAAFLAVGVLFLSSPLYLYWSRTVMIESAALFFGWLWLALLADFLERPQAMRFLFTLAAGIAGILVKATTFPAFLVLGGLMILYRLWRGGWTLPQWRRLAAAGAACLVPLIVGYAWVLYTDAVKSRNALGVFLTSQSLARWNYGSWAQRVSSHLWNDVLLQRILPDIFGYGAIPAVIVACVALATRRFGPPMAAATLAFFVPIAVFTNLHLVHNYYQYANAVFALAAAGLGIAAIMDLGGRAIAGGILVVLVGLQLSFFWRTFASYVTDDYSAAPRYRIALIAKDKTPSDGSLIVLGDDWASTIPYYSERKSFAVPGWAADALAQRLFADPPAFLGDRPLAGIVFCSDGTMKTPGLAPRVKDFIAGRKLLGEAGDCQLLAAQR